MVTGQELKPCPFCSGVMGWCGDQLGQEHACHHLLCTHCKAHFDMAGAADKCICDNGTVTGFDDDGVEQQKTCDICKGEGTVLAKAGTVEALRVRCAAVFNSRVAESTSVNEVVFQNIALRTERDTLKRVLRCVMMDVFRYADTMLRLQPAIREAGRLLALDSDSDGRHRS